MLAELFAVAFLSVCVCWIPRSISANRRFLYGYLLANVALYVSCITATFVREGLQFPAGPEQTWAVFVVLPLRGMLLSALMAQPLFLAGAGLGYVVCRGIAFLWGQTDHPSRLSGAQIHVLFYVLCMSVVVVYNVRSAQYLIAQSEIFRPPHILRYELQNLAGIEMTEFTSQQRTTKSAGKTGEAVTKVDGECTLTESSMLQLLADHDWTQILSDERWLGLPDKALMHDDLLVSDQFDKTFSNNATLTQGMAGIDCKSRKVYFSVTSQ